MTRSTPRRKRGAKTIQFPLEEYLDDTIGIIRTSDNSRGERECICECPVCGKPVDPFSYGLHIGTMIAHEHDDEDTRIAEVPQTVVHAIGPEEIEFGSIRPKRAFFRVSQSHLCIPQNEEVKDEFENSSAHFLDIKTSDDYSKFLYQYFKK